MPASKYAFLSVADQCWQALFSQLSLSDFLKKSKQQYFCITSPYYPEQTEVRKTYTGWSFDPFPGVHCLLVFTNLILTLVTWHYCLCRVWNHEWLNHWHHGFWLQRMLPTFNGDKSVALLDFSEFLGAWWLWFHSPSLDFFGSLGFLCPALGRSAQKYWESMGLARFVLGSFAFWYHSIWV